MLRRRPNQHQRARGPGSSHSAGRLHFYWPSWPLPRSPHADERKPHCERAPINLAAHRTDHVGAVGRCGRRHRFPVAHGARALAARHRDRRGDRAAGQVAGVARHHDLAAPARDPAAQPGCTTGRRVRYRRADDGAATGDAAVGRCRRAAAVTDRRLRRALRSACRSHPGYQPRQHIRGRHAGAGNLDRRDFVCRGQSRCATSSFGAYSVA